MQDMKQWGLSTGWLWTTRVTSWFVLGWGLGTLAYKVTHPGS